MPGKIYKFFYQTLPINLARYLINPKYPILLLNYFTTIGYDNFYSLPCPSSSTVHIILSLKLLVHHKYRKSYHKQMLPP
jgi:hypothetical protein